MCYISRLQRRGVTKEYEPKHLVDAENKFFQRAQSEVADGEIHPAI